MRMEADHNLIWNRACGGAELTAAGDRALRDAIELDGLIQNGGVADGFESSDDDGEAGIAGLEHFGLHDLASLLRELRSSRPSDAASEGERDRYEADASGRYDELEDSDRLQAAFVARVASHPDEFAPITAEERAAEARTQELLGRLMGER